MRHVCFQTALIVTIAWAQDATAITLEEVLAFQKLNFEQHKAFKMKAMQRTEFSDAGVDRFTEIDIKSLARSAEEFERGDSWQRERDAIVEKWDQVRVPKFARYEFKTDGDRYFHGYAENRDRTALNDGEFDEIGAFDGEFVRTLKKSIRSGSVKSHIPKSDQFNRHNKLLHHYAYWISHTISGLSPAERSWEFENNELVVRNEEPLPDNVGRYAPEVTTIRLDPEHGYLISYFRKHFEGVDLDGAKHSRDILEVSVELDSIEGYIYPRRSVLRSWANSAPPERVMDSLQFARWSNFEREPIHLNTITYEMEEMILNPSFSDDEFHIEFPPGTRILDGVSGTQFTTGVDISNIASVLGVSARAFLENNQDPAISDDSEDAGKDEHATTTPKQDDSTNNASQNLGYIIMGLAVLIMLAAFFTLKAASREK